MEAPASDGERHSPRASSSRASSASSASLSALSIDDLALGRRESGPEPVDDDAPTRNENSAGADNGASGMESKLQRNLRAQQAHYARQRRLFEGLRADAASTPGNCSPSSPSSQISSPHIDALASPASPPGAGGKSTRFQLELPRADRDKHRADDEEKGESAREAVQRVKDRALADYKRRIASYRPRQQHGQSAKPARPPHKPFVKELEQQEASNDALRRQLELLRRLQVDNNRFRVENRTLRVRGDALSENLDMRDREIELLREEIANKSARINRDQDSLANAAETAKKLKVAQKQLKVARNDVDKLREALENALAAQEVADTKAQEQILDAGNEVKRLKKTNKQLKQRENVLHEDAESYRTSIEELEQTVGELRTRVRDLKHDRSKLTAQLADKSSQFERFETSTAECVQRLQDEVAALQQSLSDERNKLAAAESDRDEQETQIEQLECAIRDKDAQLQTLEQERSSAQHKFQERRRAYREHVAALEEKLGLSISNQRADAETIGSLRRQCEAVALKVSEGDERTVNTTAKAREEARTLRRAMDAIRKYVEEAAAPASVDAQREKAMDDTQMLLSSPRQQRGPDIDDAQEDGEAGASNLQGEFQLARAAASALRHAVMDAVHELQRAQHVARQHTHKISTQRARVQDMERRLRESAATVERERERRELAEQAREITLKEKAEVLQWSEQACRKAESLESQLAKCETAVNKWLRKLTEGLRAHCSDSSLDDLEPGDAISTLLPRADKRLDELLSVSDELKRVREQQTCEIHELKATQRSFESEMEDTSREAKRMLAEVEALHQRNVDEVKTRLREQITDLESEKQMVEADLSTAKEQIAAFTSAASELQQQLAALESDVPVLTSVVHLFAATVRPLIQQVSDLAMQKRLLQRENAEFALHFDRIKCVGQVLKEMLPSPTSLPPTNASSHRRRRSRVCFRRAVIAVFAANRLRQFSTPLNLSRDADGRLRRTVYGVSTTLLASPTNGSRVRGWTRSLETSTPVIKVLPLKETVDRLPVRALLERLRSLGITDMVASAVEAGRDDKPSRKNKFKAKSNVGALVLKVLSAMDANASELLLQNVSGTFHCRALLERRRRPSSHQAAADSWRRPHDRDQEAFESDEDELPVVELIQQRIIALGKRVEDLHFQRNSLQKENYEFQFQLEQQALALEEMQRLTKSAEELQFELAELREHSATHEAELQSECDKQAALTAGKTCELEDAREQIARLELQLQQVELSSSAIESDKAALEQQIERLRQQGADEEAKADKTRLDGRRQQEEMRQLKQAVKRAHELYQKTQAQLELETMDKAALQASLEHLRSKYDRLERELREERRREVERSFDDGDGEMVGRRRGADAVSDVSERQPPRSPRSPMAVSFEDLTLQRRKQTAAANDSDSSDDDDDDDDGAYVPAKISDARQARHASSNEQFMREWRRLDVSTAFLDAPTTATGKHGSEEQRGAESPSSLASPPPTWLRSSPTTTGALSPVRGASSIRKPQTRSELARASGVGRSLRAVEIDKVNASVHDYMDRIDDKLSKMYGIPPSAAISRVSSSPSHRAAAAVSDAGDGDDLSEDGEAVRQSERTWRLRERRVFG